MIAITKGDGKNTLRGKKINKCLLKLKVLLISYLFQIVQVTTNYTGYLQGQTIAPETLSLCYIYGDLNLIKVFQETPRAIIKVANWAANGKTPGRSVNQSLGGFVSCLLTLGPH